MTLRRRGLLVLVLLMLSAGCGTLGNLFSSTSPSSGTSTDVFTSALTVGGSSIATFTVAQSGTVSVTLTALGVAGPVGLGIGTPNGTTACVMASSSASILPGGSPQISTTENPGNYCVEVFDPGTLTASTTFSITVVHP